MTQGLIDFRQTDASCRPEAPAVARQAMSSRVRTLLIFGIVSLFLAAPCFWNSRIQASDLSSHVYNAWLAQLVSEGRAPGLTVVPQSTNVLFDLTLYGCMRLLGRDTGQRIAVAAAVMVFVWGAFAFASVSAGRLAWTVMPFLAMLAYGAVFRYGFFNFYLALALCLWAISIMMTQSALRVVAACALLCLAWTAHALPVVWCLGGGAIYACLRRLNGRSKALAWGVLLLAMVVTRFIAMGLYQGRWVSSQLLSFTGADQLWVWGGKYAFVSLALVLVWAVIAVQGRKAGSLSRFGESVPGCIGAITAAGVVILPSAVMLPGYRHFLAFVSERMSLPLAICVCAVLAGVKFSRAATVATLGVATLFFGLLWHDEGALNLVESRIELALSHVPAGQRVVLPFADRNLRIDPTTHMTDRACAGRCFSYANYEPSTGQFRVRSAADNAFALRSYADSYALQTGTYVVKPQDEPLWGAQLDKSGQIVFKPLKAGSLCGITEWKIL